MLCLAVLFAGGALIFVWKVERLDPKQLVWKRANAPSPDAFQNFAPADTATPSVDRDRIETSPVDALPSAPQLAGGRQNEAPVATDLPAWAEKDCAGALTWIERHGIRNLEFSAQERLLEGLLQMEPKAVLERLDGSGSPTLREDLMRLFLPRLAEIDPQTAAIELLVRGRENGFIGPAAGDVIVERWMRDAPGAAAGLLARLPEGVERNRATLAAVEAWSAPAPAETAAWVETLPAGETRDAAFKRITLAWSGQDLEAAMDWLLRLPDGRSRDIAIATLSIQLADVLPPRLSGWVATIHDEELRQRAIAAVRAAAELADESAPTASPP